MSRLCICVIDFDVDERDCGQQSMGNIPLVYFIRVELLLTYILPICAIIAIDILVRRAAHQRHTISRPPTAILRQPSVMDKVRVCCVTMYIRILVK
jgi:hypothetical protein